MSARKFKVIAGTLLAAGTAVVIATAISARHQNAPVTLHSGGRTYELAVANTAALQEKGLGGRTSLPQDRGMLFVFSGTGLRCFWMKDTHFPLDIIWLDGQKRVRHIEHGVTPQTYPHAYCPRVPARYVIELNAGESGRAAIQDGETLTF